MLEVIDSSDDQSSLDITASSWLPKDKSKFRMIPTMDAVAIAGNLIPKKGIMDSGK